jgi:integrase
MPFADVPAFVGELRAEQSMSARALEFLILCAGRSGEVRLATWQEIDVDKGLWVVPGARMKSGKEHRVPLTARAVAILHEMHALSPRPLRSTDYVFPGVRNRQALSDMALSMLVRRLGQDCTPHGFRSSFRDWAAECTGFPNEVCEMALAHRIPSGTERAYRRGDLFKKRAALMLAWANYIEGQRARVVPLRAAGGGA